MLRSRVAVGIGALALAAVSVVVTSSCANHRAYYAEGPTEADYGENAMAAMEPPDRATASRPPRGDRGSGGDRGGEDSVPPPPPPPPPALESAGPIDEPATDTDPPRVVRASAARPAEAAPSVDNEPFTGLGAFIKPKVWTVDKTYTLEFVVGQNEAGLNAVGQNHELTAHSNIWMAQTMRVTLDSNPDFGIAPQNPDQEIQQLSPDKTASWFWNVIPHRAGKFILVARVQALMLGADGEPLRDSQGRLKGRFYPAQQVDVQVRVATKAKVLGAIGDAGTYGDALGAMFGSWEKTLGALAALITAIGAVWLSIKKLKGSSSGVEKT